MTFLRIIMDIVHIYFGILGFLSLLVILGPQLYMMEVLFRRKQFLMLILCAALVAAMFVQPVVWIVSLFCAIIVLGNTFCYLWFSGRALFRSKTRMASLPDPLPAVAVIITAKDEETVIRQTLESVAAMDYPQDKLEIILVDDGSRDGTYECALQLKKKIKNLRIVHHLHSQGKAKALNEMFSTLEHEFVLLLDADHLSDPDLVRHMLGLFKEDNVACVQVASMIRNGNTNLLTRALELEYLFRCHSIYPGKSMGIFVGSGGMFRRKDVLEAGGFDPHMLTEDVEVSYRLYKNGKRIVYDDRAATYDLAAVGFRNFYNQRYRWMRGLWSALFKHLGHKRGKELPGRLKFYFIQFTLDGFGALCLCVLQMYYFLDLAGFVQFDFPFAVYGMSLACLFIFGVAFGRAGKISAYRHLALFSFYMVAHTIPTMIALIDSYILKKPQLWVKTDRSAIYQRGWRRIFH